MKRFEMLPGIAVMRGNVSGSQKIGYPTDANSAYDAPNGVQHATRYRPSYIFHKRAKDGLLYFSVKTKQTAVLNGKTRLSMALVGATAACIKSLRADAATFAQIRAGFEYAAAHDGLPVGVDTLTKWMQYNLRDMLRYKKASWAFNQAGFSFTVNNPFLLSSGTALQINTSLFVKFGLVLGYMQDKTVIEYFVDGRKFVGIADEWANNVPAGLNNLNWKTSTAGLASAAGGSVTYNGLTVRLNGVEQEPSTVVVAGGKYSTAPELVI